MSQTLNDLPFVDLYVRLDQPDKSLFRSKEKGQGTANQFVPDQFQEVIERFKPAVVAGLGDANEGAMDFEGVRCRFARQQMSDGSVWFCARRINSGVPELEKLNILPGICQ